MGDEVDCLPAEKHESFLQEDHFWWTLPSMLKVPKTTSLQYLCNISKKT